MKYIIPFILIMTSTGCASLKKEKHPFDGTWLLIQYSGGFMGKTQVPEKETILTIRNGKMTRTEEGKMISEDSFNVEKGKVIESDQPQDIVASEKLLKQSITIKKDTLILRDQCYDCFTYLYKRIN